VRKRLDFSYDYKGRRVQKVVYYEDSGNWVKDYEKRFLYDQWNLIAELDENLNLIKTFTWGTDISGTEQGAGGVGGLLSMTVHTTGKTYFYCHDGNGNVVGLVDSSSGTVVQEYEYSPFGELLRGGEDVVNPFKFSGKYHDSKTDLVYYGYRYLSVEGVARWLNRDPIAERGELNLYGFVGNDGVNGIDVLGLASASSFFEMVKASLSKASKIEVTGALLKKVKNELKTHLKPRIDKKVKEMSGEYSISTRINEDYTFRGAFFGDLGLLYETAWSVGGSRLVGWIVTKGCDNIAESDVDISVYDKFNFEPEDDKSWYYNALAWVFSLGYNDLLGASSPQVEAKVKDKWKHR